MLGFPNPKSKKQEVKEAPKHRSTETPKPETRKREKSRWMEVTHPHPHLTNRINQARTLHFYGTFNYYYV
jgi:hypothetical protein